MSKEINEELLRWNKFNEKMIKEKISFAELLDMFPFGFNAVFIDEDDKTFEKLLDEYVSSIRKLRAILRKMYLDDEIRITRTLISSEEEQK
jgi:hypothetical protein